MQDLKLRTKKFALDIIRFCATLPKRQEYFIIGKQLMRSATSVGANYRSSCRAKSRKDFILKLSIVEEEADECLYWLELVEELNKNKSDMLNQLKNEANELLSIIVASKKTARKNLNNQSN
ncbi:four helix bundle protein [candidate division KSB1 bacterium]|nr:four helix bundle protein [candidate division KSB1 bacterium]